MLLLGWLQGLEERGPKFLEPQQHLEVHGGGGGGGGGEKSQLNVVCFVREY